jgi:hypothetical protein
MTTRNVILLVAVLALCACGGAEQQATPTGVDKQPWEAFAANTITEYYGRNPELAVSVGLHEYDGQMSDFSLAAAEEYASWAFLDPGFWFCDQQSGCLRLCTGF